MRLTRLCAVRLPMSRAPLEREIDGRAYLGRQLARGWVDREQVSGHRAPAVEVDLAKFAAERIPHQDFNAGVTQAWNGSCLGKQILTT
jgi:hypothetical protein